MCCTDEVPLIQELLPQFSTHDEEQDPETQQDFLTNQQFCTLEKSII